MTVEFPILEHFKYKHLVQRLQSVYRPFYEVAHAIAGGGPYMACLKALMAQYEVATHSEGMAAHVKLRQVSGHHHLGPEVFQAVALRTLLDALGCARRAAVSNALADAPVDPKPLLDESAIKAVVLPDCQYAAHPSGWIWTLQDVEGVPHWIRDEDGMGITAGTVTFAGIDAADQATPVRPTVKRPVPGPGPPGAYHGPPTTRNDEEGPPGAMIAKAIVAERRAIDLGAASPADVAAKHGHEVEPPSDSDVLEAILEVVEAPPGTTIDGDGDGWEVAPPMRPGKAYIADPPDGWEPRYPGSPHFTRTSDGAGLWRHEGSSREGDKSGWYCTSPTKPKPALDYKICDDIAEAIANLDGAPEVIPEQHKSPDAITATATSGRTWTRGPEAWNRDEDDLAVLHEGAMCPPYLEAVDAAYPPGPGCAEAVAMAAARGAQFVKGWRVPAKPLKVTWPKIIRRGESKAISLTIDADGTEAKRVEDANAEPAPPPAGHAAALDAWRAARHLTTVGILEDAGVMPRPAAKPAPEWRKTGHTWRLWVDGVPVARIDGVVATKLAAWLSYEQRRAGRGAPVCCDDEAAAVAQVIEWGLEQTPPVVVPPLPEAEARSGLKGADWKSTQPPRVKCRWRDQTGHEATAEPAGARRWRITWDSATKARFAGTHHRGGLPAGWQWSPMPPAEGHHDLCRMSGHTTADCPQCGALRWHDRCTEPAGLLDAPPADARHDEMRAHVIGLCPNGKDYSDDADGDAAMLHDLLKHMQGPAHEVIAQVQKRMMAERYKWMDWEEFARRLLFGDDPDRIGSGMGGAGLRAALRERCPSAELAESAPATGWQKGEPEDPDGAYVVRCQGGCGVAFLFFASFGRPGWRVVWGDRTSDDLGASFWASGEWPDGAEHRSASDCARRQTGRTSPATEAATRQSERPVASLRDACAERDGLQARIDRLVDQGAKWRQEDKLEILEWRERALDAEDGLESTAVKHYRAKYRAEFENGLKLKREVRLTEERDMIAGHLDPETNPDRWTLGQFKAATGMTPGAWLGSWNKRQLPDIHINRELATAAWALVAAPFYVAMFPDENPEPTLIRAFATRERAEGWCEGYAAWCPGRYAAVHRGAGWGVGSRDWEAAEAMVERRRTGGVA